MSAVKASLIEFILPTACAFCRTPGYITESGICKQCHSQLSFIPEPTCNYCGKPVGANEKTRICRDCLTTRPVFSKAAFVFLYEGTIRDAIISFKFSGKLEIGRSLGRLLAKGFDQAYSGTSFDIIVPLPVHWRRLIKRGFNQTVLLAEELSSATNIPMDRTHFIKKINSRPQVGLTRQERIQNVRGTFACNQKEFFKGKRVLLVDDVATTGTTISEASRTLISAGADRVCALALAWRGTQDEEALLNDVHGEDDHDKD